MMASPAYSTTGDGFRSVDGTWKSQGYGRVLDIRNDTVLVFDVTAVSCVLHESVRLDDFLSDINRINRSEENVFSYYMEGGITRYEYRRMEGLSGFCTEALRREPDYDPERNFDVFWHSFSEHYAFFAARNVDWDAVYRDYRPGITADTSNDQLYDTITEIVELIDDRHVLVEGEGYARRYSGHPGTLAKLLQETLPEGQQSTRAQIQAAAKHLIAVDYLQDSRKEAVNGRFTWGWAADGIGYFSIDSMEGYVEDEEATLQDSHRLVDDIMDRVIGDLQDASGIIVDARWNGGGYDSNALHIAGHFTDRQLLAFTKKAKIADTFTPEQEIFIPSHARKTFAGPVVYLCGRDTLSAAEIFSMAMMAMPNVTSLGEPTVGSLSDTHSIFLPNGWRLQLSNEVYKAIDGEVYEGTGIPVDIEMPPDEDATFSSYIRRGVDEAVTLLLGRR